MKIRFCRLLSALLTLLLLMPVFPAASAAEKIPDLSGYISNRKSRVFVEAMLSYHLRENTAVQQTLQKGFSAVFFFEGCSDNMDNPELTDLTYYRVSSICLALKLNEEGQPEITYFNDDCSTLPDRPLEIGAWMIDGIGPVGPATVCDGTYELYSVYHGGSYEALQLRTSYEDQTASAVYMTPDGFVNYGATEINIHTRTGNHTIQGAMWSAGCMLVGDGEFQDYADLIISTYYDSYNFFVIDQLVGTVTINRFFLQDQLYELYDNTEAVDTLLVSSRCERPEIYLERCTSAAAFPEAREVQARWDVQLMSLPCTNSTDARSIPVVTLEKKDKIDICGSVINTQGNKWYEVSFFDRIYYVYAGAVEEIPAEPSFWDRIISFLTGK